MVEPQIIGPQIIGPGSQPGEHDGHTLDYMVMPERMQAFCAAHVPEAAMARATPHGLAAVAAILATVRAAAAGETPPPVDLSALDTANLAFVDQLLGEGEVSAIISDGQAQESVLAGIWRVRQTDGQGRRLADQAIAAPFPPAWQAAAFANVRPRAEWPEQGPAYGGSAPALLTEINAAIHAVGEAGGPAHIINLSLLPHTPEDLSLLDAALGQGALIILSRGYGNCRIQATATQNCWRVRYFNSQDTLILDTIEISPIPAVALAAPEDLADSVERLEEILEIYRE